MYVCTHVHVSMHCVYVGGNLLTYASIIKKAWVCYFILHVRFFLSSAHQEALSNMRNIHVLEPVSYGGQSAVVINEMFKTNLKVLLCGG